MVSSQQDPSTGSGEALARLRRRTIIDIASRRQRPGSGSIQGLVGSKPRLQWPDLTEVLAGMPWAVVGAVAASLYMPERATADLDIAILERDAELAGQRLRRAGFLRREPLAIGGWSWEARDGTPLDVIEGRESWWPDALAEAAGNRNARGAPVLPLAYLVLAKLLASRVQDLADVTRMLGAADESALRAVRAVVGAQAPDVARDLESLIILGRLESEV